MTGCARVDDPLITSWRVVALTVDDARELADLRREQFLGSSSFRWTRPESLDWSATDDASLVLGVRDGHGALVATTRATPHADVESAQAALQYSMEHVPVSGRIVVSGRSATRRHCRGLGLNALLRHTVYRQMDRLSAQAIVAVVYEGAPHLQRLKACGYTFHRTDRHWDDEAVPLATPSVICLRRDRLADAMATARAEAAGLFDIVRIDDAAVTAAAIAAAGRAATARMTRRADGHADADQNSPYTTNTTRRPAR